MQDMFLTRCSPSRLQGLYGKLTKDQAKAVMDMGFGGLLEVKCNSLNRVLCLELVNSFNLKQHVMIVKGLDISISYRDVGTTFGLPDNVNFFLPITLLWRYYYYFFGYYDEFIIIWMK